VSLSVQLGILFALATAFVSIVGFLYKHRGAVESPPIEWRSPIRSSFALFRSKWYVIGIVIAFGSWGFHVAALALAPISIVQSVIAGGLVLLTVVADRLFGFSVTRREWIGVALTAAGLAFLAATLEGTADSRHSEYDATTLAIYIGLLTIAGLIAAAAARPAVAGTILALSTGLIWGASDVAIKAVSDHTDLGFPGILFHPLAAVIALWSFVGLVISAKSLQVGKAVPVIAVTSACANVVTIASGTIVFGEPLPDEPLALTVRILAFVLVVGAAALTPPPMHAAERGDGDESADPAAPTQSGAVGETA
jgi:drug/metabolite transporter (DMT)-like permease